MSNAIAVVSAAPGCNARRGFLEGDDRLARLRVEQDRLEREQAELERRLAELRDQAKAIRAELAKDEGRIDRVRVGAILPLAAANPAASSDAQPTGNEAPPAD